MSRTTIEWTNDLSQKRCKTCQTLRPKLSFLKVLREYDM